MSAEMEIKESEGVRSDILAAEDIRLLVDTFYQRVQEDTLLEPVFTDKLGKDWSHHMPVMYRFWGSVLLGEGTYSGNPLAKHINMPLEGEHFQHWLTLFTATVDELFSGEKAEEAKIRARSIAYIFQMKMGIVKRM